MKLGFSQIGYSFERGVQVILTAYLTSSNALDAAFENCRDALTDYQIHIENGEPPEGEWDDDGNPIWTKDLMLSLELEDTKAAISATRRAFVLALYHHWERYTRRYLNADKRDHNSIVAAALAAGIHIDEGLSRVRDLANLIKHANSARGTDLMMSWPTLLPTRPNPSRNPDWLALLVLDAGIVLEVASIVRLSGPRSVLSVDGNDHVQSRPTARHPRA